MAGFEKLPQFKLSSHIRLCTGTVCEGNDLFDMDQDAQNYFKSSYQAPSSAPASNFRGHRSSNRELMNNPTLSKSPQEMYSQPRPIPESSSKAAAKAAESAGSIQRVLVPRKNIVTQNKLNKIPADDQDNQKAHSRPLSRQMNAKNTSGRVERSSIELSAAKKKAVAIESPKLNHSRNDNFQNSIKVSSVEQPKKVPEPNFHENSTTELLDVSNYLVPCQICGRKFMEDRLVRYIILIIGKTHQRLWKGKHKSPKGIRCQACSSARDRNGKVCYQKVKWASSTISKGHI